MTKEKKHSKHYYEEGRNGWTPTSTIDKLKENQKTMWLIWKIIY